MALSSKLCIVTGANTGIGRVIATRLAQLDARVIMACRSEARAAPVCDEIRKSTQNNRVEFWPLDLSSLASVREFAKRVGDEPVHILVSNAGVMQAQHELTEDGYETTWQVNTLAPFLLAQLLLPSLKKASVEPTDPARLIYGVCFASRYPGTPQVRGRLLHGMDARARFRSESSGKFDSFGVYGTSKLAATILHMELAQRSINDQRGGGVCINVASPGMVNTELNRNLVPWPLLYPARWVLSLLIRTPEQGADTPLALATSIDQAFLVSGKFFRDSQEVDRSDTIPVGAKYDQQLANKLWDTCTQMLKS